MLFANTDIPRIIPCKPEGNTQITRSITAFAYDSRRIVDSSGVLFFALKGKSNDGHQHIQKAYDQGIRDFVISDSTCVKESYSHAGFFVVEDTLEALQNLANHIRSQRKARVLAITGSNGKTICKEWLWQLSNKDTFRSPLSYNSQIGVPLSLSMIPEACHLAIIEAGISQTGEMEKLSRIIQPEDVLITNIGEAHNAGFRDKTEKLIEKCKLAKFSNRIFYCKDDDALHRYLISYFGDKTLISWSKSKEAHLQIYKSDNDQLTIEKGSKTYSFKSHLTDNNSVENIGHIANYLLYENSNPQAILNQVQYLEPVEMRLQLLDGINGCKIINDTYNADIYSLSRALSYLEQQSFGLKKTLILTPLDGTGVNETQVQEIIFNKISKSEIDRVIFVSEIVGHTLFNLPKNIEYLHVSDVQKLYDLYFENEIILVKGARRFRLERFVEQIESKAQTTALEINLTALEKNIDYLKSKLNPSTKVMAVIKASGYGSGSHAIAKTLENKQVDYLAVAHIDEGIFLRNQGISRPIVVLNPDKNNLQKLITYNLQPEVYSIDFLKNLKQVTGHIQSACGIHINLDTGMNRLGFKATDIQELITLIQSADYLKIISVFSHLSSSEDKNKDKLTDEQFRLFIGMSDQIQSGFQHRFLRHILNSTGIIRHPQYQLDMVRTGLSLYGLNLSKAQNLYLEKVHRLKSYVLQIKKIQAGENIGYNAAFTAEKDMIIATLNIGYADGLRRSLSNNKWSVKIKGRLAPIVGKISMDLTTVDITHIHDVRVGQRAVIFDETLRLEDLATAAKTIPYEILTGINERVKRVYFKE